MTETHDESGRFAQGNDASLVHGGEIAVKRLQRGEPLTGIAHELQEAVHAEIELDGMLAVMRRRAERHQAIADLFYGLLLGADDIETADKYVKRFGWLNSKAWAMLRDLRQMEESSGGDILDVAIEAAKKRGSDGTD